MPPVESRSIATTNEIFIGDSVRASWILVGISDSWGARISLIFCNFGGGLLLTAFHLELASRCKSYALGQQIRCSPMAEVIEADVLYRCIMTGLVCFFLHPRSGLRRVDGFGRWQWHHRCFLFLGGSLMSSNQSYLIEFDYMYFFSIGLCSSLVREMLTSMLDSTFYSFVES